MSRFRVILRLRVSNFFSSIGLDFETGDSQSRKVSNFIPFYIALT